jgi:hypothetical protein
MQPQTRRRHLLRLAGLAATATLAGCGGDGDGDGDGGDGGGGYGGSGYGGGDDSDSAGDGGGTDGEEGYANWWQVERLDGTQLGRRDLAHPHSRQPFTRSSLSPFDIPADVTCVVVRGHDQTHGYGGRAVLVNLDSGATRGILQGADPQSFGAGDCP